MRVGLPYADILLSPFRRGAMVRCKPLLKLPSPGPDAAGLFAVRQVHQRHERSRVMPHDPGADLGVILKDLRPAMLK